VEEGVTVVPVEAVTPGGDDGDMLLELADATVADGRPAPSPERLAELQAKIARTAGYSRASATLRAYVSDWAHFVRWCAQFGLCPLPATATTVAGYVSELVDPSDPEEAPRKVSTITRRLASIGAVHKAKGLPNPCVDQLVKTVMRGARRTLGVAPQQKKGVSTADITTAARRLTEQIDAAVAQGHPGRPIDIRDRLILLLGFAGGLRRSELSALAVADVEAVPEGLLLHLRRSKTDPEGAGRTVEIVYGKDRTSCPVGAYRAWRTVSQASGPVLRHVDRHGHLLGPLSAEAVATVVKRHMSRLGYHSVDFAGHSLRRGMATTAARNGASERTIMRTTGHTSTTTVRGYIEAGELFTDPASGYLGL
jgi:site-specific recombinase XerD